MGKMAKTLNVGGEKTFKIGEGRKCLKLGSEENTRNGGVGKTLKIGEWKWLEKKIRKIEA